ncbi:MAG: glycosyltransferase family 4 protein [Halobacteriota archaeon]
MKIAAFRNFLSIKAGAQGAFINMMESLRRRNHKIDIYVLDISDELRNELEEHGFNVTSLSFKEWKIAGLDVIHTFNDFRAMYQLRKWAKKINNGNYDIAFVDHHYYSPLLLPFFKIPKVYYCYEPPRCYYETIISNDIRPKIYKIITILSKYIDKYCVKFADLILCNSDYEREYIWRTYGIFPVTNYLGVDLEKYRKLNLEKENLVVSVGVLSPVKAHDFVIRSIGMIPKNKRPRFVIITAGITSDKEEKKLYKLAAQNNVDLEIKNKYISDEEFAELHSKAKVVAIAYIMDPSIEPVALAFETPIVAVREAGARETIINGETGILTNRDEREFAEAIEYLLDHPEVAAEMGRKGREWIEKNFTWGKCAENLEKNFERVLNSKR